MQEQDDRRKLYVVTRADLSPGQQATQSAHAAFSVGQEHPATVGAWFRESTYLVLLTVPDRETLETLAADAARAGLMFTRWAEPDMGDELTAVAITPSPTASRLVARLPLTGREVAMA